MIEIKNVSKSYDDNLVLDHVSTEIQKGKITAFIGSNGAGKSTLLGIITRVLKADGGEIIIDGRPLGTYTSGELATKLSVLRQHNNLQMRLTVRDLVAFGRYPYSKGRLKPEDHKVIDNAIAYMELDGMQDKYIDELSGGEHQRAFIAMVVAQDTEYIFLDEPLNNLDMKHSVEIMQMLKRLCADSGKTVVIVIHDINFASCYADRILAIQGSHVHINDAAENVIQPDVLQQVYDMPFRICDVDGDRICVYYSGDGSHRRGGKHRRGHRHGEHHQAAQ